MRTRLKWLLGITIDRAALLQVQRGERGRWDELSGRSVSDCGDVEIVYQRIRRRLVSDKRDLYNVRS